MADGDLKPPPRPVLPETPMLGVENTDRQSVEAMRYGLASAGPLAQAVLTNNPAALAAALPVGLIDSPRRCTSTTRPSDPTQGQFIFELDTMSLRFWSGTAWVGLPASGVIEPFVGINAPPGWLLCAGQDVSRTQYADLFSSVSISFTSATTTNTSTTVSGLNNMSAADHVGWGIAGNGIPSGATISSVTNSTTVVISAAATVTQTGTASLWIAPYRFTGANNTTTFLIPDLRGRSIFGKDNMGGSTASRVTNTGTDNSGILGTALGAAGGDQRFHGHNHGITDPSHRHQEEGNQPVGASGGGGVGEVGVNYNKVTGFSTTGITINTNGTGTSQNMPPMVIANYIIKV